MIVSHICNDKKTNHSIPAVYNLVKLFVKFFPSWIGSSITWSLFVLMVPALDSIRVSCFRKSMLKKSQRMRNPTPDQQLKRVVSKCPVW